jgi:hypothetical protein
MTSVRCEWALLTYHSVDRWCMFYACGCVRCPQQPPWAWDNCYAIHEHGYQECLSVSIWAGIVGDTVMWPCLLPDRLTGQWYCDFLETVVLGLLEDVPLAVRQRLWFQHDRAPAHCGEDVWKQLNTTYPEMWTGNWGLIRWPLRSLDLTLMGFFFSCGGYRRSRGKTTSNCDNGQCKHVKACSRECCHPLQCIFLEMDGSCFEQLL